MVDYSKLTISPPARWWFRYKLLRYSASLVERFPILCKISRGVAHRFLLDFGDSSRDFGVDPKYADLLEKDENNAHLPASSYGYDSEIVEIITMLKYQQQLNGKNFMTAKGESATLYREAIKTATSLLENDPEVSSLLDFGVSYGYMNSVLAERFSDRKFFGVDRSPFVKLYNERIFSNYKNLSFYAGDVFDLLNQQDFKNGLLFHARTLLLLPPSFIRRLYAAVFKAGFKYIVGFEQLGISRQTNKPYEFSDSPKKSVCYRRSMYTHNYPGLLKECGFSVQEIDLVKTNHSHRDFRLLKFVAKRV